MDKFLKLDTSLEEGKVIKFEDEEILPFSADAKNQQDTLSQQKRKKDTKAALALLEELVREKDSLRIGLKKILQRVDLFSEKLESFQQVIVDLSTFEDSTCASTSNNLAAPEHSAPLLDPLASCTVETSSQDGASDREVHSRGNPSSSKRTHQSVGSRRKRIRRSISPSNSLDGVATNSTEDKVSSLDQHHDSSPFPFVDVVEEKYSASQMFRKGDKSTGESVACDDGPTEIANQLSIHKQPDDPSAPIQYQREKRDMARREGRKSRKSVKTTGETFHNEAKNQMLEVDSCSVPPPLKLKSPSPTLCTLTLYEESSSVITPCSTKNAKEGALSAPHESITDACIKARHPEYIDLIHMLKQLTALKSFLAGGFLLPDEIYSAQSLFRDAVINFLDKNKLITSGTSASFRWSYDKLGKILYHFFPNMHWPNMNFGNKIRKNPKAVYISMMHKISSVRKERNRVRAPRKPSCKDKPGSKCGIKELR